MSEAERREFLHWLEASQDNALAYAQCELAWEMTGALSEQRDFATGPQFDERATQGVKFNDWRIWGSVAASALAVGVLVATTAISSTELYETAIGEQRVVHLDDGSSVMLNTNTLLEVDYTSAERSLNLKRGEAFFTVAKNPDRPFVVDVGATEVRALGTGFNIERRHSDVEVAVTHGLVEVAYEKHFWQEKRFAHLKPGQGIVWQSDTAAEPQSVDLERVTAWQASKIYFDNERLIDALAEYNRYTSRQYVLVDDALANEKISGVFNVGDDNALSFALQTSLGARIVATDNRVLVLASLDN